MKEIKCPECGSVFPIDESSYAAILNQVRDEEFSKQLESQKEIAVKLAEAQKDKEIEKLKDQMTALKQRLKNEYDALRREEIFSIKTESNEQIESLRRKIEVFEHEKQIDIQRITHQKDEEYREKERKMIEEQNETIKRKDDEIAYLKDYKTRLSTKMVGETLEQHCEIEFNKIRMAAYPNASFEKDTNIKSGTKGDFIFRDYDDGIEYISIMFEMKNQMEETTTKHKNEDYFKKLDKDRKDKNCEYAVLVSMLELDNDFYNQGIADVSYRYEKMYVVRPQCFLSLISLLRNAAKSSLQYKKDSVLLTGQNTAAEIFNSQLQDFKAKFSKNYHDANTRFEETIKQIDKSIEDLKKARESLLLTGKHLRLANDKAESLTIKRLTNGNPQMQKYFEDAGIEVI